MLQVLKNRLYDTSLQLVQPNHQNYVLVAVSFVRTFPVVGSS